jgi:acyl-CoA thioesterase FadM
MMIFRTGWLRLTARFKEQRDPLGEHRLTYLCSPSDIDPYMHMTNGRYPMNMDMARLEWLIRSGIWWRMKKENFWLVAGTISVRFRREIKFLKMFDVTARIITWDDRWTYVEHKLFMGKELAAIGIVKIAWVDAKGRLSPDRVRDIMNFGPPPPMTELVKAKNALDELLVV